MKKNKIMDEIRSSISPEMKLQMELSVAIANRIYEILEAFFLFMLTVIRKRLVERSAHTSTLIIRTADETFPAVDNLEKVAAEREKHSSRTSLELIGSTSHHLADGILRNTVTHVIDFILKDLVEDLLIIILHNHFVLIGL